jgi:hypothetical protein
MQSQFVNSLGRETEEERTDQRAIDHFTGSA